MAGGDRLFDGATRKRLRVRTGRSEGINLARYGSARLAVRPHLGLAAHSHGADGNRRSRIGRFAGNALLLVADSFYRPARHLSPSRQKRPPHSLAVRLSRVRPCNCDALGCPAPRSFRRAPPIPCSSPSAHGRDLRLTPLPLVAHGPTPFGPARILPNALRGNSGRACAHLLHGADRPRALRASRADARRRRP